VAGSVLVRIRVDSQWRWTSSSCARPNPVHGLSNFTCVRHCAVSASCPRARRTSPPRAAGTRSLRAERKPSAVQRCAISRSEEPAAPQSNRRSTTWSSWLMSACRNTGGWPCSGLTAPLIHTPVASSVSAQGRRIITRRMRRRPRAFFCAGGRWPCRHSSGSVRPRSRRCACLAGAMPGAGG